MAVKTIEWKNDRVVMLDQRLLPQKEVYRVCRDYKAVAAAIRGMVIRGAPATAWLPRWVWHWDV